jgi:hypothetical protein
MANKPFAAAIVGDVASAGDFIAKILKASTEHSITGKSLDGAILLRNGDARHPYSCEPSVFPDTSRFCFGPPLQKYTRT